MVEIGLVIIAFLICWAVGKGKSFLIGAVLGVTFYLTVRACQYLWFITVDRGDVLGGLVVGIAMTGLITPLWILALRLRDALGRN